MQSTHINIGDSSLTAAFDPRTGALVRLSHQALAWNLVDAQDGGLAFSLSVPRPGRRVAVVEGLSQAAPQVITGPNSVAFRWNGLVDDEGCRLDIELETRTRIADGFLVFDATIVNRSDRTIEMVAWPQLHAIRPYHKGGILNHWEGHYDFWKAQIAPVQVGCGGYWGQHQPEKSSVWSRASFCLMLSEPPAGSPELSPGGWYVGLHENPRTRLVTWAAEQRPGTLDSYSLLMSEETVNGRQPGVDYVQRHLSYVAPGQTHTTAPIAFAPYTGDWHNGADVYRRWRATWFRDPKRPAWVEDVHSWLQIQIYGAEDMINFRYTDLPAIAEDCAKHGILAIQLTGWADGGQDRGNPSHEIDPALGTREELATAIAQCQAMGVKVIPFSKFTWWDQSRPDYATEAQQYLSRDPYGHPHPPCGYRYYTPAQQADLTTSRLIPTCTASPAWRERACVEMRKLASLGADGTLFDECQHHYAAQYCFAPDHGHPVPGYLYAHDAAFGAQLRDTAREYRDDFLMAGELCTEAELQEYHLTYTRFGQGHQPVQRYIGPFIPIMMAADGFDDRNKINKCLEYRYIISYEPRCFKGRPSEAPLSVTYGRQVDDLRRRHRRYLWDAIFQGARGATVTVDGKPTRDYSLFETADRKGCAVVVCNTDARRSVQVAIALEQPGTAPLSVVRPENPDPLPYPGGPLTLAPRSVVVVIAPGQGDQP